MGQDTRPDLVVKGGTVLTMAEGQPPMHEADVLVKNGRIAVVQPSSRAGVEGWSGVETIDASHGIVMPGLINAHCHSAMTIFRGYADELPLKRWLFDKIFPAEAGFLSRETVYRGTLLACLEMIASGTTSFVDGYFFEDGAARAVHQSGLRALLAQGVIDFPAPGVADPADNLMVGQAFLEKWRGVSERIVPGLFCHSPTTCSEKTLAGARDISNRMDLPLQIHLSETREEVEKIRKEKGKRPVEYLDAIGLLSEGLIAVHAVYTDAAEVALMAERGAKVAHVPESNMKLGCGAADVSAMMDAGLTVGLGTDGCASNNNLDMFQEMDTAAKLGKVITRDPQCLSARDVLEMATVRGAALMGMEKELGTLEKGKRADIVVVNMNAPHLCPGYDPFSALVYAANGADVSHVVVDGKILYRDGRFLTLDAEEIMARVREIGRRIAGAQ
ncbi:MAG: amidohydrolase [Deltaproteobacteria bacterium]|nr:amidohydrolase [Deltaproteobacteria bacterium]